MRFYYVALAAAAAVVMSADGLQAAPNSAESTSLRTVAETRDQSVVEGKTQRFLVGEPTDAAPRQPAGYGFSALRGNDDGRLRKNVDVSNTRVVDDADDEERKLKFKKKKKKKKKKKRGPLGKFIHKLLK